MKIEDVNQSLETESLIMDTMKTCDGIVEPHRGLEVLRVSDAIQPNFCPRERWLRKKYNVTHRGKKGFSSMRIIWALGRAAEKHIRDTLATYRGDSLFGDWRCTCGESFQDSTVYPDWVCDNCDGKWHYEEMEVSHNGLYGHPDFILCSDSGVLQVVECKSIQKKDFESLSKGSRATPLHSIQAAVYAELLSQMGFDVDRRIRVVYVCKDAIKGGSYYEFLHEREEFQYTVEATLRDAHLSERDAAPPLLQLCESRESKRAKQCEVCSLCFDEKEKAGRRSRPHRKGT